MRWSESSSWLAPRAPDHRDRGWPLPNEVVIVTCDGARLDSNVRVSRKPESSERMPERVQLLDSINRPEDLKALTPAQMPLLAKEIREFLVDSVSKTGGHLGPNLGVVELTIALHRVFDSPRDSIEIGRASCRERV